jgi:spermidine synthase
MIVLERRKAISGEIAVALSLASGAMVYWQGGRCQSEADSSGVSYAPYIHAIYDLVHQMRLREILIIGCGGGTLGTMLAQTGYRVTIVDVDPAAIDIAKTYFSLDKRVLCVVADGCEFLLESVHRYDGIVIDAFDGQRIPPHLCTLEFFRLIRRHLNAGGSVLMNVLRENDADRTADEIAEIMQRAGLPVRILDEPEQAERNTILIGGVISNLALPVVRIPPSHLLKALEGELARLTFRTSIPIPAQLHARARSMPNARRGRRLNRSVEMPAEEQPARDIIG